MTRTNPWFEMDLKEDADFEPDPEPATWIERLAGSTAFGALLGIALLVTVPILLLGLVIGLPLMLVSLGGARDPSVLLTIAAIVGGAVGMLGLLRSRRRDFPASTPRIRPTVVMLAVGVVTAIAMAAEILIGLAPIGFRWLAILPLGLCACLAILSIEGVAEIVRLSKLASPMENPTSVRASPTGSGGRPKGDLLPWIFLGAAIAQALTVAAISVSLA